MPTVTPKQKEAFLKTLTETCNVSKAAKAAKHPRSTWYKMKSENPDFAEAWQNALDEGLDELEGVLYKRAKEGLSDTAAFFLLNAHRREVYRPQAVIEHTGSIKHDHEHRAISETDAFLASVIESDGEESALPKPSTH